MWDPSGHLLFNDIPRSTRFRWSSVTETTVAAQPTDKANGMAWGPDSDLVVCEHGTSAVVSIERDGSGTDRHVLASSYEGRALNSPNDVALRSDGCIFFTDPSYGRTAEYGIERAQELPFQGVYLLRPGARQIELLADDFLQPNGLCLSPDESVLYVNDTDRGQIRAFDVAADGSLCTSRIFASSIGSGDPSIADTVDGMKVDALGNVWVTGPGDLGTYGITVFAPSGERIGTIDVPEKVGNMCWGGEDGTTLYICASTSLYRLACKVPGHPPAFQPL